MKRDNWIWILAVLLISVTACSRQTPPPPPKQVVSRGPLPRPKWLANEPLIIVGNWDSMAIFRRRAGGNPLWQEDDYAREHTEEAVRKLKELGVTMAVIHFYKAYGLEAEKEQLQDTRKLAALCKKYGIRVGVYVGSTIAYETFLNEKPEAEEWFVPPYLGRPVFYFTQTFRKRVYFMHPGYREYMKRVLELAVKDLKVDLIHFDNTSLQAQPPVFFHPQAIQDFRTFLTAKYSPQTRKERFGFAEVNHVEPPPFDQPMTTINDPLFQEWADFRCEQLANYYGEMESFIRGMNPETAVESNPHSGINGENTIWNQGVDYPRLLSHMDVIWSEEGNEAGMTSDGILVSKIRTYKMASTLKNSIFTYTGGEGGGILQMAEAMAYNRQNLGMVGGVLAGYELPEEQRKYIRFYTQNFDLYKGIENKADVAVLHSFASMAYNNDLPWQSTMLFEQALIQNRVPFDVIFDDQLKDLSKYRVLVLADQECLSDAEMVPIRVFVQGGGGLVATEHSSLYTHWRQRRKDFGLQDLFKVNAPRWLGARAGEPLLETAVQRNQVGPGRVVYIPAVKPAIPKPPAVAMASKYWKLPVNSQEIVDAVNWAAGGRMVLEVKAPNTVTAELYHQKDKQRLLLHLLNYASRDGKPAGRIEASVLLPTGKTVQSVTGMSPDDSQPGPVPSTTKDGRVVFTLPDLKTYGIVVIQLQ